jgi:hypothetical protein
MDDRRDSVILLDVSDADVTTGGMIAGVGSAFLKRLGGWNPVLRRCPNSGKRH